MSQHLKLPLCMVIVAAAYGLLAGGPASAAQELKMVEHATTDATTDTALPVTVPVTSSPSPMRCSTPRTRSRSAPIRVSASAPCQGRRMSASGRSISRRGRSPVEGPFLDSGDSVLAITGGTGEYAGAQGEMALSAIGSEGKAYNFTYKIK